MVLNSKSHRIITTLLILGCSFLGGCSPRQNGQVALRVNQDESIDILVAACESGLDVAEAWSYPSGDVLGKWRLRVDPFAQPGHTLSWPMQTKGTVEVEVLTEVHGLTSKVHLVIQVGSSRNHTAASPFEISMSDLSFVGDGQVYYLGRNGEVLHGTALEFVEHACPSS